MVMIVELILIGREGAFVGWGSALLPRVCRGFLFVDEVPVRADDVLHEEHVRQAQSERDQQTDGDEQTRDACTQARAMRACAP